MIGPSRDWLVDRSFGRWTVRAFLAQGGMASVWLLDPANPGVLKVPLGDDPDLLARAVREGRIQGAIVHPNIVRALDIVDVDGRSGTVLEFVEGGVSLDVLLQREPLSLSAIEALFGGILDGVEAAHAAGYIHRDLKPGNVLLAGEPAAWIPKVADFGLARPEFESAETKLTRAGYILGSAAYMAPEQARDAATVDGRADVWSLGCILYELHARRPAFPGHRVEDVLANVVAGRFVPLDAVAPDVPDRVLVAIGACLQVDPTLRPGDVATLREVWLGRQKWVAGNAGPRRSNPPALPSAGPRSSERPPGSPRAEARPADAGPSASNATFVSESRPPNPARVPMGAWIGLAALVVALAGWLAMG